MGAPISQADSERESEGTGDSERATARERQREGDSERATARGRQRESVSERATMEKGEGQWESDREAEGLRLDKASEVATPRTREGGRAKGMDHS
jgi:hypothetical protein